MKKRFLFILLICLLVLSNVFAANSQKIYSVDDDIYSKIATMYLVTGHAMPSSTGPWNAAELRDMMDKISKDELPLSLRADYEEVLKELDEEPEYQWKGIGATFSHELNLQLAFHSNNDSEYTREDNDGNVERLFVGRRNWASNYVKDLYPLYALTWDTWVDDAFYADLVLGLYGSPSGNPTNDFGTSIASNNIPTFQNFKYDMGFIDANFPRRAFFSVGNNHWNIQFGRDKISWGVGTTGNMTVSNNLPYHDMARFTAFSDKYKYTFLASSFPYSANYYDENGYHYTSDEQGGLDGLSMYLAHRLEGRFFQDKLSVSVTEGLLYESSTNHVDLLALSPMYVFHNAYTPLNGNSVLTFEFDVTPFNGFNAYGQLMIDDYGVPGETIGDASHSGNPNRVGVLTGVTYAFPALNGIMKANLEYAQTDPYAYLRENIDFVVPVRYWNNIMQKITWDEYFMGYTYGCDARVLSLKLDYEKGPLTLGFNFLDVFHGTHDQWTISGETGGDGAQAWEENSITCTSNEENGNTRYSYAKNAIQNTIDLRLLASYEFMDKKLTAYSQADVVIVKNAFNVSCQDDVDFQLILGAKYTF